MEIKNTLNVRFVFTIVTPLHRDAEDQRDVSRDAHHVEIPSRPSRNALHKRHCGTRRRLPMRMPSQAARL